MGEVGGPGPPAQFWIVPAQGRCESLISNGETRIVNAMGLTAIDLGLRGAACGVFLLIVLAALQRRLANQHALLGIAMCAGGIFYAIVTAPNFPKTAWWWTLPILSAQPAVFWLWARAAFDDDFVLKRWHGALWLSIVAYGFAITLGWAHWPALAGAAGRVLALGTLVLALAAAVQTVKTWRADLVARRRRLRLAMLAINIVLIAAVGAAGFAAIPVAVPGAPAVSRPRSACSWWPCSPDWEPSPRSRPSPSMTPRQPLHPATRARPIVVLWAGSSSIPGSPSIRFCSGVSTI